MVCDICHKNHATIHLTEIIEAKMVEMHICQACAQTKAKAFNDQLHLSGLVGGLAEHQQDKKIREKKLVCSSCGFKYDDFKAKGRLGCGRCYEAFRTQLIPLIKKIHGSTRHVGKRPLSCGQDFSVDIEMREMRARLKRAIQLEEYEEAVRLRDKIKQMDTQ